MAQPLKRRADAAAESGTGVGAQPGRKPEVASPDRERRPPTSGGGDATTRSHPVPSHRAPIGWDNVLFTHVVIIGVPLIVYYYLRVSGASLFELHCAVATVYLITALMICWEASIALSRRFAGEPEAPVGAGDRIAQQVKQLLGVTGRRVPVPTRPVPRSTFIVAAYLPNEQDIIVDTLTHILDHVRRPEAGLELILAYNSPVELPIEAELHQLAASRPELRILRVEGSESKAENLNAAIEVASGEIVGILDADHYPPSDCFERAWRWLESEYDVVQGRNVVRNRDDNFLTRMIGVEFECMYGVSHPARSLFVDTAIFGGSNGYWRVEALRRTRFDPRFMTEDIDASSRALLDGYRIVADRSIVSTELAPTNFRSLWFQRKRWSQGWLEVTLRYQREFWSSRRLTFWQKLYWTYLLVYRELYPPITLQILPLILSLLLLEGTVPLKAHWYLWSTALITFASGPYQTLVAVKNAHERPRLWTAFEYALFVFFYVIVKNMISVVAIYDHLMKRTDWVVTRREMTARMRGVGEGA
ncbi:MAG TPA: glycosyltransferase family 2 protein [Myxococcota bacterium]|nr:glycosyltransferase family 2 protein [Myxococcota bacterium]